MNFKAYAPSALAAAWVHWRPDRLIGQALERVRAGAVLLSFRMVAFLFREYCEALTGVVLCPKGAIDRGGGEI
jgi:hypothetical protein